MPSASATTTTAAAAGLIALFVLHRRRRRRSRGGRISDKPLAFATCEALRLRSAAGLSYKLIVSLPIGYEAEPEKRYPVLFALDAEPYLFPLLAVCARTNHFMARSYYYPDAIIVGLVADLELEDRFYSGARLLVRELWDNLRPTRARDYLPTDAESPWGAPGAASLRGISGHAEEFVDFLAEVAVPCVDARYRTDPRRRALIGKSFGGSGVAHAMQHDRCSSLFAQFVLGSPSLAWDECAFFRREEAPITAPSAAREALRADVFVCVGSEEANAAENAARLKVALEKRPAPAPAPAVNTPPAPAVNTPPEPAAMSAAMASPLAAAAADVTATRLKMKPPSQPSTMAPPATAPGVPARGLPGSMPPLPPMPADFGGGAAAAAAPSPSRPEGVAWKAEKGPLPGAACWRRGEVTIDVVPHEKHGSVSYPFVHHALDWLKERWEPLEDET